MRFGDNTGTPLLVIDDGRVVQGLRRDASEDLEKRLVAAATAFAKLIDEIGQQPTRADLARADEMCKIISEMRDNVSAFDDREEADYQLRKMHDKVTQMRTTVRSMFMN